MSRSPKMCGPELLDSAQAGLQGERAGEAVYPYASVTTTPGLFQRDGRYTARPVDVY